MGRSLHLPARVVDIIAEHHGNSILKFFYINAQKEDPNVNPADYSYNGNPPTTRESGVVMLADMVEAACKSLEKPSATRIEKFVQKLINDKIEEGQLNNCDLTFKDIHIIEETFTQQLISYYHSRVKYPEKETADPPKADKEKTESSEQQAAAEKQETSGQPEASEKAADTEKQETSEQQTVADGQPESNNKEGKDGE